MLAGLLYSWLTYVALIGELTVFSGGIPPIAMTVSIGDTVKGTVVKIVDYGAIVRLPGGITGLIHISEIADAYVRDVREYLNENDEVAVRVLRLNAKGRYDLSIKQCTEQPNESAEEKTLARASVRQRPRQEPRIPVRSAPAVPVSFEDRLSRFLKDSEERQHDLRRNIDAKRGRK